MFDDFKKYQKEYDVEDGDPNELFDDEDTTPCFECKTDLIEILYNYHTSCCGYCNACNICFNRDYKMTFHKTCETFRQPDKAKLCSTQMKLDYLIVWLNST